MKKYLPLLLAALIFFFEKTTAQSPPLGTIETEWEAWEPFSKRLPGPADILAIQDNHVFAATDHGLFQSDDNGETWYRQTQVPNKNVASLIATDGMVIAVVSDMYPINSYTAFMSWGSYVSTDGGQTFEQGASISHTASSGGGHTTTLSYDGIRSLNDSTCYFIGHYNLDFSGPAYITKYTTDYGVTWHDAVENLQATAFDGSNYYGLSRWAKHRAYLPNDLGRNNSNHQMQLPVNFQRHHAK